MVKYLLCFHVLISVLALVITFLQQYLVLEVSVKSGIGAAQIMYAYV